MGTGCPHPYRQKTHTNVRMHPSTGAAAGLGWHPRQEKPYLKAVAACMTFRSSQAARSSARRRDRCWPLRRRQRRRCHVSKDPFGNILSKSGPLADVNLHRFSSKEFHANSGLVYYLYRYYEPGLQRWMNRDPIADTGFTIRMTQLISGSGEINYFKALRNEPINAIDLFGLACPPGYISAGTFTRTTTEDYTRQYSDYRILEETLIDIVGTTPICRVVIQPQRCTQVYRDTTISTFEACSRTSKPCELPEILIQELSRETSSTSLGDPTCVDKGNPITYPRVVCPTIRGV